jgi:hypothetical protein
LLEELPRVDDGVMASFLPKKQPEGETKFRHRPKGFASRRLFLQSNRKRKGAPLIKTMRLFRKKKLGLGELGLSDMNKNSSKYSKSPQMIT